MTDPRDVDANDLAGILRCAEELLRDIVPEFRGKPVYLVLTSDPALPDEFSKAMRGGDVAFGFTWPGLSWALREFIGDRWEGPGFACVIDDIAIRQAPWLDDFVYDVLGVVLHEAAHGVECGIDERPLEHRLAAGWGEHILTAAAEKATEPEYPVGTYLAHHGPAWIRIVAHLAHRATARHVYLSGSRIASRELQHYADVLIPEVEAFENLPLSVIIQKPLPEGFEALWQKDLEFASKQPQSKDSPSDETDTTSQTVKDHDMNAVQSILSKLLGKAHEQRKGANEQYQAAVVAIADGVEPDNLEGILAAAAKGAEDLAADVKLCLDRRVWRGEVQAAETAKQELEQMEAHVEELRQAMIVAVEAAQRPYDQAVQPLQDLRSRCRSLNSTAERAAQKLAESAAPPADLIEKKAAAEKRLAVLRREAGDVNHEVRNSEFALEQVTGKEWQYKSGQVGQSEKDAYAAKKAEAIAHAEAAKAKDVQIRRHIAEAQREAEAAEAEMRERQMAAV